MFKTQCMLGLVSLYIGLVFSVEWDLAVSHGNLLEFYLNEGKTNTLRFESQELAALTYDEVHDMLIYVDKHCNNDTICGYDISSKLNQCFMERKGRNIRGISFDPTTELVFFSDINEKSINWIPVKSGSNEHGNLLTKLDDGIPTDIAVDSCSGYVYWITTGLTTPRIERALLNGSEKEVVINIVSLPINTTYTLEPHSLTIDQETQRMYWIEPQKNSFQSIYYADLNGKGKTKIYNLYGGSNLNLLNPSSSTLIVAKSSLFWVDWRLDIDTDIWKFAKLVWTANVGQIRLNSKNVIVGIAANYKVKDRIQGNNDCKAQTFVGQKNCEEPCVHGVKVGQSLCKCTPGYIGERCDVSVCEVYCLHGNCSVNDQGIPDCRCNAGYSGERCEVAACHNYCLNNGVCTLNEKEEPSCECVDKYEGSRCEIFQTITLTFSNNPAYSVKINKTVSDFLSNWRKPKIVVLVDES